MSEDDQRAYADFVIDDLRLRLRYADSGSYHYIVDEIILLCSTCEVAKSMGIDFVAEIMVKYGNRRALMKLLSIIDYWLLIILGTEGHGSFAQGFYRPQIYTDGHRFGAGGSDY